MLHAVFLVWTLSYQATWTTKKHREPASSFFSTVICFYPIMRKKDLTKFDCQNINLQN